jgi:hypothetical protein
VSAADVAVTVTRYQVCAVPEGIPGAYNWAITVEYRGGGLWAVLDGAEVVDARGRAHVEPRPSDRTDRWRRKHYLPEDRALALARRLAPTIVVSGYSVADVLARHTAGAR